MSRRFAAGFAAWMLAVLPAAAGAQPGPSINPKALQAVLGKGAPGTAMVPSQAAVGTAQVPGMVAAPVALRPRGEPAETVEPGLPAPQAAMMEAVGAGLVERRPREPGPPRGGPGNAPLIDRYREGGGTGSVSSAAHAGLFWVGALFAVLGAAAVIANRRPMRSALGLLVTVLATAGLYLLLRAELLAAVQVLVYAGAIVVLFVFVITFLDQGVMAPTGGRRMPIRVLAVLAVVWMFYLIAPELAALGFGTREAPVPGFGTTRGLGTAVFTTFLVPFEAISALLLTAIVGATAVARGKPGTATLPRPAKPDASAGEPKGGE